LAFSKEKDLIREGLIDQDQEEENEEQLTKEGERAKASASTSAAEEVGGGYKALISTDC
jgi:hypothetical protein